MINQSTIDNAPDIQQKFRTALPFRHAVVDNFLQPDICEQLLRDFPAFDPEKARNEVGQIGNKAVFENVGAISSFYKKFYKYINSTEFLGWMSKLTGIPDLMADATLFGGGTHDNRDGQELDVHIDFNVDERRMLHRRVNLLIYLNKEWEDSWGGHIELHSDPRNPQVDEIASFAPLFNRAVMFETSEYSWHGFERIDLPTDKKHLSRKSFSIYLYTKDRPAEEVVAPHTTFYIARPLPDHLQPGHTLSRDDVTQLSTLVARRDGLLGMYQKLLVEKERRLRDFVLLNQKLLVEREPRLRDSPMLNLDQSAYHEILASRSWRLVMTLHRIRYKLTRFLR